jgi:16S rRNA processing protein RimM
LQHPQGTHALLAVQGTWFHKDGVVLKFEGIDTISDAEAFIGCDILVEPFEVEALPSGTYYRHNLVGCEVLDEEGRAIGSVESIEDHGANTLLVLRMQNGQEVLVPAAKSFVLRIDEENRQITIRLPAELLELNR